MREMTQGFIDTKKCKIWPIDGAEQQNVNDAAFESYIK